MPAYIPGAVSNFVTDADKRRKDVLSRTLNLGANTTLTFSKWTDINIQGGNPHRSMLFSSEDCQRKEEGTWNWDANTEDWARQGYFRIRHLEQGELQSVSEYCQFWLFFQIDYEKQSRTWFEENKKAMADAEDKVKDLQQQLDKMKLYLFRQLSKPIADPLSASG